MKVAWVDASSPSAPVAACGRGPVAARLAERAARAGGEAEWSVARFDDWTVVTGDDLPWVDGVVYLGALPDARGVLVPVHRRPAAPVDLVLAAVRRLAPGATRVAVIPDDEGADVDLLVLEG